MFGYFSGGLSVLILLFCHFGSFQFSAYFIRPILLPVLFSTDHGKIIQSVNDKLRLMKFNEISPDVAKFYTDKRTKDGLLYKKNKDCSFNSNSSSSSNSNSSFNLKILNITFDILISFSIQLIILFLFEILHFTDFYVRHFDWYLTLSTLILSTTYIIPSYLLFDWIFYSRNQMYLMGKYLVVLLFWSILITIVNKLAITNEIECNILQLSLYMTSLFGVSCLAILNGIVCILGTLEAINWYFARDEDFLQEKAMNLNMELNKLNQIVHELSFSKTPDSKEHSNLKFLLQDQLHVVENLTKELGIFQHINDTIYTISKFGFWIYCIFKDINGIFKFFILLFKWFNFVGYAHTSDSSYNGSGDFISEAIVKLILSKDTPPEEIEKYLMAINFVLSLSFFYFSFSNVIVTFEKIEKIFKNISGSSVVRKVVTIDASPLDNVEPHLSKLYHTRSGAQRWTQIALGEMSAIYVISTALMLNSSSLPMHLSGWVIKEKLIPHATIINVDFISDWFDRWFVVGSLLAILGLLGWRSFNLHKGSTVVF